MCRAIPRPGAMLVRLCPSPQEPSTSLIHSGLSSPLAMSRAVVRWPVP
ncbi:hypothetical protein HDA31_003338 [Micromonospora carbonacea subsp. aurantiaca]|nr:hypothetical protein [Micromonospora carbonacea]